MEKNYLNLTDKNWRLNTDLKYLGYKIIKRPYHRKILALSLVLMVCSVIFPDFGIGVLGGIKILQKWG